MVTKATRGEYLLDLVLTDLGCAHCLLPVAMRVNSSDAAAPRSVKRWAAASGVWRVADTKDSPTERLSPPIGWRWGGILSTASTCLFGARVLCIHRSVCSACALRPRDRTAPLLARTLGAPTINRLLNFSGRALSHPGNAKTERWVLKS